MPPADLIIFPDQSYTVPPAPFVWNNPGYTRMFLYLVIEEFIGGDHPQVQIFVDGLLPNNLGAVWLPDNAPIIAGWQDAGSGLHTLLTIVPAHMQFRVQFGGTPDEVTFGLSAWLLP